MKKKDLKKISPAEIGKKLDELKREMMKYNAQISTGAPSENPGRIRSVKKTIARMNLMIHKHNLKGAK